MSAGLLCKWTHNCIVCMYVCMYVCNLTNISILPKLTVHIHLFVCIDHWLNNYTTFVNYCLITAARLYCQCTSSKRFSTLKGMGKEEMEKEGEVHHQPGNPAFTTDVPSDAYSEFVAVRQLFK